MNAGDFRGQRLLVAAHEAGGGSLLAALTREWRPARGSIGIVSDTAAPYFADVPLPVRPASTIGCVEEAVALIEATQPEWVIVGTSAFASVEKTFMRAAARLRVPLAAFVDHYWNLWQRFAHEETAERWFYRPDLVFVPTKRCLERIIEQGAERERVRAFSHPLLRYAVDGRPARSREAVRRALDLPEAGTVILFVCEYGFPESEKWQWEQAPDTDLIALLEAVLGECDEDRDAEGRQATALVKLHPAQRDFAAGLLDKYRSSAYRVVRQFDKQELFAVSNIAFGLDSMLLLEASWAGVPAYSCHASGLGRGRWLSDIHPEIRELATASDCAKVIRDVACHAAINQERAVRGQRPCAE